MVRTLAAPKEPPGPQKKSERTLLGGPWTLRTRKTPSRKSMLTTPKASPRKKRGFRKSSKNVGNMCILHMCTLFGIVKVGSQTPPWSLQTRCPFPRDPPEPSQSQLWSSQRPPRTLLGAPKDVQGRVKSATSTIKKRWKYVYLGLKHHQKTVFCDFRSSSGGPGTLLGPHPHCPDPPHGAQKRSQAIPGTSLGEPWAL